MVKCAVATVILVQLAMLARVSVALPIESEQTFERRASSDGVNSLLSKRDQMDLGARHWLHWVTGAAAAAAVGLWWHRKKQKEKQNQQNRQNQQNSQNPQNQQNPPPNQKLLEYPGYGTGSEGSGEPRPDRKRSIDDIGKREWDEFEKRYWDHDLEGRGWDRLEERGLGFDELDELD
ncbi:hypothetical protein AX14_007126 [Amanita brunnescens Koide BX004]|nr:hypothetical protein AX14_007126 [Amanita brunnescens Koide BX004]